MSVVRADAVIVNYNGGDMILDCVRSVRAGLGAAARIVVVDNASTDGSAERLPADVDLVALPENAGFGVAVNTGVARTTAPWVLTLGPDAVLTPGAPHAWAGIAVPDDVGAIALEMRFAHRPDLLNSCGIEVDRRGVASDRLLGRPAGAAEREPREVFGASAGAALLRRAMLDALGGFDPGYFMYLEDVDLAWRARMAGWRALFAPGAVVLHRHSATSRHRSPDKYFHVGRSRVRLLAKNADARMIVRHGAGIVLQDAAYVVFTVVRDRTLAPIRGRIAGLREWSAARQAGAAGRRPVELARPGGLAAALVRDAAWLRGGTGRP